MPYILQFCYVNSILLVLLFKVCQFWRMQLSAVYTSCFDSLCDLYSMDVDDIFSETISGNTSVLENAIISYRDLTFRLAP